MRTGKFIKELKSCKKGVWFIDDTMYSRLTVDQCLKLLHVFHKNVDTLKVISEACEEEPAYYKKDLRSEYRKFREELLQLELSYFDDIFS